MEDSPQATRLIEQERQSSPHYAIISCAILHCIVLQCTIPYCIVLDYATLRGHNIGQGISMQSAHGPGEALLHCNVLYCYMLQGALLQYRTIHLAALYQIGSLCFTLHQTILYCAQCCTVLYCSVLQCALLCCTVLHYGVLLRQREEVNLQSTQGHEEAGMD